MLLDATDEFCGAERAVVLAESYRAHGVHVGRPPRLGPDGQPRYGWDERLRLGKGRRLAVAHTDPDGESRRSAGTFLGYERGASVVRLELADGTIERITTAGVWDVADA